LPPFFVLTLVPELFTGFAGSGEAFLHSTAAPAGLSVQLGADADGVRIGLGDPAAERGNLAPHCMSQISSFSHELILLLFDLILSINCVRGSVKESV